MYRNTNRGAILATLFVGVVSGFIIDRVLDEFVAEARAQVPRPSLASLQTEIDTFHTVVASLQTQIDDIVDGSTQVGNAAHADQAFFAEQAWQADQAWHADQAGFADQAWFADQANHAYYADVAGSVY
jgi:hypothetical protein